MVINFFLKFTVKYSHPTLSTFSFLSKTPSSDNVINLLEKSDKELNCEQQFWQILFIIEFLQQTMLLWYDFKREKFSISAQFKLLVYNSVY